jgi:hypothetical protein
MIEAESNKGTAPMTVIINMPILNDPIDYEKDVREHATKMAKGPSFAHVLEVRTNPKSSDE